LELKLTVAAGPFERDLCPLRVASSMEGKRGRGLIENCFGYHDYFPETERDGSLRVARGESVTFRYRLHFHRGDAAAGRTDQRWADFALPPAVGVEG
jgi:hypothetical protein